MAKVGLTKLGLSINKDVKHIEWNGQDIEVLQYLPSNEKLELCSRIINDSVDDQNFYNPGRVAIFQAVEILTVYTNIHITDKQKEDICKLFDLLQSSGFAIEVYKAIPENELNAIQSIVECTIENIYKYRNSVLGILDTISNDYSNLELDSEKIKNNLSEGKNVEFLKAVMDKLG